MTQYLVKAVTILGLTWAGAQTVNRIAGGPTTLIPNAATAPVVTAH